MCVPGHVRIATDPESLVQAAKSWEGEALETAIFAAGGAGGYVRTPEEWAAHPHAAVLAGQKLLEIIRIGDAEPEPLRGGGTLRGRSAVFARWT